METYDVKRDLTALYAPRNTEWTMLIAQPSWITESMVDAAKESALARKKLVVIGDIRRLAPNVGRCAQALHVGSDDEEGPRLAELHGPYLAAPGLEFPGPHHEVYLSNPRGTDPARLKTVLRQPVRPAGRT